MSEIGSDFSLGKLPNEIYTHKIEHPWFLGLDSKLLSTGRGAISLILEQEKNRFKNNKVLLPAYICDSVIQPFTDKGFECFFYNVDPQLRPCLDSFEWMARKKPSVILHLGYFGFNTSKNLTPFLQESSKNGVFIIEDQTHTMLSSYQKFDSNSRTFGSIRKWLGVPCGAFVNPCKKDINIRSERDSRNYVNLRQQAMKMKAEYLTKPNENLKKEYLRIFAQSQKILNQDTLPYEIDLLSKNIVLASDYDVMVTQRRQNYMVLLEELQNVGEIQHPFPTLPDDVTPLFFPIIVKKNRDKLRSHLIQNWIYCPIHWPKPNLVKNTEGGVSDIIYNRILSIPIDQRYQKHHMMFIAKLIKKYFSLLK